MFGSRKSMRSRTLGYLQHPAVVVGDVDRIAQERLVDRQGRTIRRNWKCSWWMWKSCSSVERFSMIQSSTSPCLTTISGSVRLRIERLRRLAVVRQKKCGRAVRVVRILRLLGKIQFPDPHRRDVAEPRPSGGGSGAACAGNAACGSGASAAAVIATERAVGIVLAGRAGIDRRASPAAPARPAAGLRR